MALIQPYQNVQQVSFQFWAKPVLQASDGTYYSPGFDGPTYASSPWDYLYLGVPSTQPFTPGLCTVAVNRTRDVDKKKAAGNDGARVTIHGVDAAMVEIAIRIWTPEQLRQLAALWPTLFPNAYKGAPPAYDVQHPMLTYHNIKSLQFIGGEGPDIDERRIGMFRLHAIEFLKPGKTNATKTAVGSIGSLLDPPTYPKPSANTTNLGPR
jgi:hypothetical protein